MNIYNIWDGKFSNKIYIQRSKNKACNNYNIQIKDYELQNPKGSPTTRPRLWYHLKENLWKNMFIWATSMACN